MHQNSEPIPRAVAKKYGGIATYQLPPAKYRSGPVASTFILRRVLSSLSTIG